MDITTHLPVCTSALPKHLSSEHLTAPSSTPLRIPPSPTSSEGPLGPAGPLGPLVSSGSSRDHNLREVSFAADTSSGLWPATLSGPRIGWRPARRRGGEGGITPGPADILPSTHPQRGRHRSGLGGTADRRAEHRATRRRRRGRGDENCVRMKRRGVFC